MNSQMNKTKPQDVVILIDIDDVLTYFVPAWVKWLDDKYGLDVKYEDITEWEVAKFFPTLTPKQIFAPLGTREFCESVQVRPDAVEYVKKLYDMGYQIYLCTATNYHNIKDKYEIIIKQHFPYIDWQHVIVTSKKQMIRGDYLIDDCIDNLIGGEYIPICMAAPHNEFLGDHHRFNNWKDIYDLIIECETKQGRME